MHMQQIFNMSTAFKKGPLFYRCEYVYIMPDLQMFTDFVLQYTIVSKKKEQTTKTVIFCLVICDIHFKNSIYST